MRKKRGLMIPSAQALIVFVLACLVIAWAITRFPPVEKLFYPFPNRVTIEKYAQLYGVDPLLVVSVMREESKFLPQSVSHKGAIGLMQLMPDTARWIAQNLRDKSYSEQSLLDPEKNIQYGTWYLANLEKAFAKNTVLVLAAYNGGRGHVQEWINTDQIDPANVQSKEIPFQETREYVDRVLKSYQKYIMLYRNP